MKIQANQKKADEYNKKTKGTIAGAEAGKGEGANKDQILKIFSNKF